MARGRYAWRSGNRVLWRYTAPSTASASATEKVGLLGVLHASAASATEMPRKNLVSPGHVTKPSANTKIQVSGGLLPGAYSGRSWATSLHAAVALVIGTCTE